MTNRISIATAVTALVTVLTTETALAGQYTATLEKAEANYSMAVEVTDFDFADFHISSLSFGAINRHGRSTDLSAGLVIDYDNTFSFSLDASNDNGEFTFDFQTTAFDLETSYGLLNFELGLQDDQIAGSLSLTNAGLRGLHDATFLANAGETNIGFSLSGKTNYGFNLEASAQFSTKNAARNTLTLSINGNF